MGLLAVACLHFPEVLTTPEARAVYPMPVIRGLIQAVLVIAFALGAVCAVLSARAQRRYGLVGVLSASLATLAGGSEVAVDGPVAKSNYVGLDWLLLNLLVLGLLFVPMERMFTRIPAQPIVRKGFRTDMVYFAVSHLLVQVSVLLTMAPARVLFGWTEGSALQRAVASQPLPLQFLEAMFLADLFGYASHRAFHAVPFLWRFHHIHHSSEQMDWLAGSRLHIVDILVMRAVGFVPIYLKFLVIVDGDHHGWVERKRQLDVELGPAVLERVARWAPTWSIETWVTWLSGANVDESTSLKTRCDLGGQLRSAVLAWQSPRVGENARVPSLTDARSELERLRGAVQG
jgi:hypothetical protein